MALFNSLCSLIWLLFWRYPFHVGDFPRIRDPKDNKKITVFKKRKKILFKLLHLFPFKNTRGSILGIVGDNMNMTK